MAQSSTRALRRQEAVRPAYLGLQLDFRVFVHQQVGGAGRISQLTSRGQFPPDQFRPLLYTA